MRSNLDEAQPLTEHDPTPTTTAQIIANEDDTQPGPSVQQVPSFPIAEKPTQSCQIIPTSSLEDTLSRIMRASIGSSQWRPVPPTPSILSQETVSSGTRYLGNPDGVFARGQLLPLIFQVLGGSMQELAEGEILVCQSCHTLI